MEFQKFKPVLEGSMVIISLQFFLWLFAITSVNQILREMFYWGYFSHFIFLSIAILIILLYTLLFIYFFLFFSLLFKIKSKELDDFHELLSNNNLSIN
ncbi:MAG: hypothetical protein ACTSXH_16150 [Promethearchaeota archaeon]